MIHSAEGIIGQTTDGPADPWHESLEKTKEKSHPHGMMESHLMDNGTTTQDISGLNAGTYVLTVTDANSCTDIITVNITEPTELTLSYTQTDIDCNSGNNGVINITPNGGTPAYSFNWSSPDGSGFVIDSEDQSGLTAGTYTVVITDINSCTVTSDITITEPPALAISESHINVSCKDGTDGSIDVTVSGGTTPYTYDWGAAGTTEDVTNLVAGDYNLTVTDVNGCTIGLPTVTITEPAVLTHTASVTDVSCGGSADGEILVTPAGGSGGFEYSMDGGGSWIGSDTFTGLMGGDYDIQVQDMNGCLSATTTETVSEPAELNFSVVVTNISCNDFADGSIEVNANGGSGTYEFSNDNGSSWTGIIANPHTFIGLSVGSYDIQVRDGNGCYAPTSTENVNQPDDPIAWYPLNGNANDISCIQMRFFD